MKKIKNILLIALLITTNYLFAYKWVGITNNQGGNNDNPQLRGTANCEPPKTSTDFEVNNVRARVNTGGDMWWDLQSKPLYEVPKGSGRHALFAGSIWVGGKDSNGQLKLAAQRFRSGGLDFWAGPLIKDGNERGNVSAEICREYDRHFAISKKMVSDFRDWYRCSHDPSCTPDPDYSISDTILNWPGNGPVGGYDPVLAPYRDVNDDGYYNPYDGDYPYYEFPAEKDGTDDPNCKRPRDRKSKLYGDYTLWWVYNDRGNIHTETKGSPIGMEFRSQAFAFATNDELNNMTFYNYNITNRSTYTLYETYFGVWTDADLGNPDDDYVGCDVTRGLGYCYNGDEYDETAKGHIGYGNQPPAIGIDFFEGPYQDETGIDKPSAFKIVGGRKVLDCNLLPKTQDPDGLYNGNINGLNFGDSVRDNERWGMRRFLYFLNQGGGPTSDPEIAQHYYNYLTGKWKDDSPLCFGGSGHSSSPKTTNIKTDFMFPGNPTTDICDWGSKGQQLGNWNEILAGNPPYDKRFVQSAGPFTLKPGAVNDITLGAVWARANSGGAWASVDALQKADDKAQTLFETCFRVMNGPDAPDMKIIELDRKLIFILSNKTSSNNYLNSYLERDDRIVEDSINNITPFFSFQGYQVYQLLDNAASIADRYNNDKAKLVFSCDKEDGVKKLVNYTWNDEKGANDATIEALGTDSGISHSFVLDKDAFNQKTFVNNREYYFTVIAYGYNASKKYNENDITAFDGIKQPYVASRQNIRSYTAIPHRVDVNGEKINSDFGYGIPVTMIEGYGNGNYAIDLTDSCIDAIMSGYPWNVRTDRVYKAGHAPISVKIINPLDIPNETYTLKFQPVKENEYGFLGISTTTSYKSNAKVQEFTYLILNSNGDTVVINKIEDRNGRQLNTLSFEYGKTKEEVFFDLGFSISYNLDDFSLSENNNAQNNGFIDATAELRDSLKPWLQFAPDMDGETYFNWIRVCNNLGSYAGRFNDACNNAGKLVDPEGFFGKIILLNGNWAPFFVTSPIENGPKYSNYKVDLTGSQSFYGMQALSSIDFYFTSDMSKWTRCCVLEMSDDPLKSIGSARKFQLRQSPSVDKYGKPILGDTTHGLGWFPGYAIDVRTGERLNIAFGEDSSLPEENGCDMVWNPSSNLYYPSNAAQISEIKKFLFGGKHYIYVFANSIPPSGQNQFNSPLYDSCRFVYNELMEYEWSKNPYNTRLERPYRSAMWVSIPYLNSDYLSTALKNKEDWKDPMKFIQTDIKIRLRVASPYQRGIKEFAVDADLAQNDNYPMFKFSTSSVASSEQRNSKIAKDKLAGINIVPNPYYGYSTFEREQLDTYVRITNLPKYYMIKIYNSNGSLIRSFDNRTGNNTYAPVGTDTYNSRYLEWDLKNENNVAISSGMYLIHVRAYDPNDKDKILGEKILKWFGALRPVDLNNF